MKLFFCIDKIDPPWWNLDVVKYLDLYCKNWELIKRLDNA